MSESGQDLLDQILADRKAQWNGKGRYKAPKPPKLEDVPTLPTNWVYASFDQLTKNFDGSRVPLKRADRDRRSGEFPYYGASGVIDDIDDYLFDGEYLLVSEDGANLLARSTPIAFQARGKFWVNNHAHIVQTHGGIPLGYIEHYFNGKDIARFVTGTAQPKLNQANLNQIPIPLPPLPEQRRIVARIEELFSRLDAGVAALRHAKAQLQRYRQSVLAAAVTGQLTQAWREQHPDTEPASELLERILEERREQWNGRGKYKAPTLDLPEVLPDLPKTWTWSTSGHLFNCIVPNRDKPKSFTGDVPWVTLPDFDGRIIIDHALDGTGLTPTEIDNSRARLVPKGSVIMSCIGRFGLAAVLGRDAVVNQQLHAFLIPPDLPARYFAYSLQAQRTFMESIATSTTIAYLNKTNCNRVPIALPPLAEQHQIVAEVEARTTAIDHLEAELDRQITRSNRLRQSTLAFAFSGRL